MLLNSGIVITVGWLVSPLRRVTPCSFIEANLSFSVKPIYTIYTFLAFNLQIWIFFLLTNFKVCVLKKTFKLIIFCWRCWKKISKILLFYNTNKSSSFLSVFIFYSNFPFYQWKRRKVLLHSKRDRRVEKERQTYNCFMLKIFKRATKFLFRFFHQNFYE